MLCLTRLGVSAMNEIKILGIVGSQRRNSSNRMALRAAQELVPAGVAIELIELHGIPFFEPRREHRPPGAVVEFRERVRAADAILFATPECNHAVPGGLKSAIDWAARPVDGCDCAWAGKPAAVMTATTGCLTTLRAQHHLRQMLATLQMPTVDHPAFMKGIAAARFGPDGSLHDESTRQFIQQVVLALVTLVRVNWSARRHGTKASA